MTKVKSRSALLVLLAASQARLAIEARRCQMTAVLPAIIGVAVLPFVGVDALNSDAVLGELRGCKSPNTLMLCKKRGLTS